MKGKHLTVQNNIEKIEPGMKNLKFFYSLGIKVLEQKLILHFVTGHFTIVNTGNIYH